MVFIPGAWYSTRQDARTLRRQCADSEECSRVSLFVRGGAPVKQGGVWGVGPRERLHRTGDAVDGVPNVKSAGVRHQARGTKRSTTQGRQMVQTGRGRSGGRHTDIARREEE